MRLNQTCSIRLFILFTWTFTAPFGFTESRYGMKTQGAPEMGRVHSPGTVSSVITTSSTKNKLLIARHKATARWEALPLFWGEMTSIAMDPSHPETAYVGTRDAGVFKTTNGGETWLPARNGLTFFPIRCLVIDPGSPDTLYAGTDFDGIWKSTNGGATWLKTGAIDELVVFNILVNPQDSNTLYAATAGGVGLAVGNIYKSINGGITWILTETGIPRYSEGSKFINGVFSMTMNPEDPSRLYVGTHYDGVYATENGGEVWIALKQGIPFTEQTSPLYDSINALAIDPHHSNRLAGIIAGKYYIFDEDNWQAVNQGNDYANSSLFTDFLYFHPGEEQTIYSAGTDFTISSNGGETWEQLLGWARSSHVPDIAFHHSRPDTILAATDILFQFTGGVQKTDDRGQNWVDQSHGITAGVFRSIAMDPSNPDTLYAGSGTGHLFNSSDGGDSWGKLYLGSKITDIAVDPSNSHSIFVASSTFLHSSDQGSTFTEISSVKYPYCITINSKTPHEIYVGTSFFKGIFKSVDSGNSFSPVNEGLPENDIRCITIDPMDSSVLYTGMRWEGLYKTVDGGTSWQYVAFDDSIYVNAIEINPENHNELLAGVEYLNGSKIFQSKDGGATWRELLAGIASVFKFKYHPGYPDIIYAATEGYGVLISENEGKQWYFLNQNLFYPLVYSIEISEGETPRLFAATYGSGIYRRDLSHEIEVPTHFIPHIADSSQWETRLILDNATDTNASVLVTLYDHELEVQRETIALAAGKAKSLVLDKGTCGKVIVQEGHVTVKESFIHQEQHGIAEFELNDFSSETLHFLLPNYTAETLTWMGIAFMNTSRDQAEVQLKALDSRGNLLAEHSETLPAFTRSVGVLEHYFPAIDFQLVSRVIAESTQPLCGINISGKQTEKLLFTKATGPVLENGPLTIPHIATSWSNWENTLIFDNTGQADVSAVVKLNGGNSGVIENTISIPGGHTVTVDLNQYSSQSPDSGLITFISDKLAIRQSFKSISGGGVAEFLLNGTTSNKLVYSFPTYVSEQLDWMGLTILNLSGGESPVSLKAYGDGLLLKTIYRFVPGNSRMVDLLSNLFPEVYEEGIDRVIVESNSPMTGINISGNGQTRFVFTHAFPGK